MASVVPVLTPLARAVPSSQPGKPVAAAQNDAFRTESFSGFSGPLFNLASASGRFVMEVIAREAPKDLQGLLSSTPLVRASERALTALRDHDCVLFQSRTGTGKTTILPGIFMEDGYSCVFLEPRRFLVEGGAAQTARYFKQTPGPNSIVGWGHGYDAQNLGPANNCQFLTTAYFLYRLLGHLADCEHAGIVSPIAGNALIFFDEWHERSVEQTFTFHELRALQMRMRHAGIAPFKIVCATATMPADDIAEIDGPLIQTRDTLRGRPALELRQGQWGTHIATIIKLVQSGKHVLIHCHSKPDAELIERQLRSQRMFTEGVPFFEVVTLHSQVPRRIRESVRTLPADGIPKVIVSTLSRTGENFPFINAVVELGLTRRTAFLDEHGCKLLTLEDITQHELEQGMGRVGRVLLSTRKKPEPDLYYWLGRRPMAQLTEAPPLEAQYADLTNLVLRYRAEGHSLDRLMSDLHPEIHHRVAPAVRRLQKLGLFSPQNNVTKLGHIAAALPLDAIPAKLVAQAIVSNAQSQPSGGLQAASLIDLAIAAAAIIESEGVVRHDLGDKKPWLRHSQDESSGRHEMSSDLAAQLFAYLRYRRPDNLPKEEVLEDAGMLAAGFERTYDVELLVRRRVAGLRCRAAKFESGLAEIFSRIALAEDFRTVSCKLLASRRRGFNLCITAAFAPYAYFRAPGNYWRGQVGYGYRMPHTSIFNDNAAQTLVVAIPRAVQDEEGRISFWLDFATGTTPADLARVIHTGSKDHIEGILGKYTRFLEHEAKRRRTNRYDEGRVFRQQ